MNADAENLSRASFLSEQNTKQIGRKLLQISARRPGDVESWLILQIKAEFKTNDLYFLLV